MEFNFEPRRVFLILALFGVFACFGGFSKPATNELYITAKVQKAWMLCMLIFAVGAASTAIVDHRLGHMDPINLRPAYVLLGVLLMTASIIWLLSLKQGMDYNKSAAYRRL